MGIQRSSTNKPKMQPGNDRSTSIRASNVISHLIEGGPISIDDASYDTWVVEHPSALGSFDQMMRAAKGKKIAVFLDYDGTLAPIVDNPDLAFMSDEMRAAVREVAKYFPTAIISGRSRDKGNEVLFQPAKKFLPAIQKMRTALKEKVMKIQGARVEDNRFCISVHFRQVREEDYEILEKKVKSVLEHYPEFHLSWGKKVMEIRPSIEWDKGNALEYLLDTLGLGNSNDVLPVYIGDDRTDEDAFKSQMNFAGNAKKGPRIPNNCNFKPKDTKASFSLRDPSEVLTFLLRLARWRKSSSSSRLVAQIWGVSD
ncbi:hypothetical protein GH714_028324 [Hevea brasiliensis]|uniref:Trehalose 6-phosphate phosphatase n=1 Tax=Hevea brasiliensis TaxID=3981 RepID=A0A6A6MJG9_HEVBR|nr:hypothetical protein GH714_028324 [Hevea brasiliensis]